MRKLFRKRAWMVVLCGSISLVATDVTAAACRRPARDSRVNDHAETDCKPQERLVPYDGERASRSGPGFVDLGNGTELRVGGRAQMDYDTRR
jgi:hypothetical protein